MGDMKARRELIAQKSMQIAVEVAMREREERERRQGVLQEAEQEKQQIVKEVTAVTCTDSELLQFVLGNCRVYWVDDFGHSRILTKYGDVEVGRTLMIEAFKRWKKLVAQGWEVF